MLSYDEFRVQIADAYEHLYDLVYLRTHPLADLLIMSGELRKERAWQLHHLLIDTIRELDPGAAAPTFSREWRRHRLMLLRYIDGMSPQAVADQLAISRRHYYRALDGAFDAIADILWNRHVKTSLPGESEPNTAQPTSGVTVDRLELLRLEAAQMAQSGRYAHIAGVTRGVLALLGEKIQQHDLHIEDALPEVQDEASVDPRLIRQLLLGLLGYLVEHTQHAVLQVVTFVQKDTLKMSLVVDPASAISPATLSEAQERVVALQELAVLSNTRVSPVMHKTIIVGFEIEIPIVRAQRLILVVDDNEDVLELLKRYLNSHDYQVLSAQSAQKGLELAQHSQPYAIILDLMMPEQDGWDLLQFFQNQPTTQQIPIIICSVLRQKELALSLGATAFIEKPVSEETLISVLDALDSE